MIENALFYKKNAQKFGHVKKKVVILQPFCVCSARGREKNIL